MIRNISTYLAKNHSLRHRRICSYAILRQGSISKNNYTPHTPPRESLKVANNKSWRPFSSINSEIEHNREFQQEQELPIENQNTFRESKQDNTYQTRKGHNHKGKKAAQSPTLGATTEWIKVVGVPPLSTLDELLVDIDFRQANKDQITVKYNPK